MITIHLKKINLNSSATEGATAYFQEHCIPLCQEVPTCYIGPPIDKNSSFKITCLLTLDNVHAPRQKKKTWPEIYRTALIQKHSEIVLNYKHKCFIRQGGGWQLNSLKKTLGIQTSPKPDSSTQIVRENSSHVSQDLVITLLRQLR